MHILIVDDEPLARQRLNRMIESIDGFAVAGEAANGVEAVEAVNTEDPDIVLMDVRMPGEDGLQAARKISEMHEPPAVIFCTAYDEYALQAFETLATGYLLKPVQEDQLIAALHNASKINKAQRHVVTSPKVDSRQNIAAKTRRGLELIPLENIFCFIADHKYEFAGRYLRVHRNALVAIDEISGMQRSSSGHYEIQLRDCDHRPAVSRRHLARVRESLSNL